MTKRRVIESSDDSDDDVNISNTRHNMHNNNKGKRRDEIIISEDENSSELSSAPSISPARNINVTKKRERSVIYGGREVHKAAQKQIYAFDILENPMGSDDGDDRAMDQTTATKSALETPGSSNRERSNRARNEEADVTVYENQRRASPGPINTHEHSSDDGMYDTASKGSLVARYASRQPQANAYRESLVATTLKSPERRSKKGASDVSSRNDLKIPSPALVRLSAHSPSPDTPASPHPSSKASSANRGGLSPLIVRIKRRPASAVEHSAQWPQLAANIGVYLQPGTMDVDTDKESVSKSLGTRASSLSSDFPDPIPRKPDHPVHDQPTGRLQNPTQSILTISPITPSFSLHSSSRRSSAAPITVNSVYEAQLDEMARRQWSPLAKMRERLANTRLEDYQEGVISDSEEEHEQASLRNGGVAIGRLPATNDDMAPFKDHIVDEAGNARSMITHRGEDNYSVALSMRRSVGQLKNAATSVWGMLVGATSETIRSAAPVSPAETAASEAGRKEEATSMGTHGMQDGGGDTENASFVPSYRGFYDNRAESMELPSPPLCLRKLPPVSPTTPTLSRNDSNTPITINTPATEPSADEVPTPGIKRRPTSTTKSPPPRLSSSVLPPSIKKKSVSIADESRDYAALEPAPYNFSYDSSQMRIQRQSPNQGTISVINCGPSIIQSLPSLSEGNRPKATKSGPIVYVPKRHFLGVEIRRPKPRPGDSIRRPITISDDNSSINEPDDLSDSELTPDALGLYLSIKYYQRYVEPELDGRKRKGRDVESSSYDSSSKDQEYQATVKAEPKRSYKKRKLVDATANFTATGSSPARLHAIPSPAKTYAPAMRQPSGAAAQINVPFGTGVDDIDPSTLRVRPVRQGLAGVTKICHQCRNSSTTDSGRIQCGNTMHPPSLSTANDSGISDIDPGTSSRGVRCNKTFCERCLRGWYALDDNAISFLRGRENEGAGAGTGLGIGIVAGKWICPVCIDSCMCTVCSKRMNVSRARYGPSAGAVNSNHGLGQKPIGRAIRTGVASPASAGGPTLQFSEKGLKSSGSQAQVQTGSRKLKLPSVPAQWLPTIPTPTPGLDPIFYEATRPCTRDFPTGAPPPTAANHAPILYQAGAMLEKDGLEDSFTGSEMDEDEPLATEEEASIAEVNDEEQSVASDMHTTQIAGVLPIKRRNYLIVTPGRRLPTTTKKIRRPTAPRYATPPSSTPVFHLASPSPGKEIADIPESLLELMDPTTLPIIDEETVSSPTLEATYRNQQYGALPESAPGDADMYSEEGEFPNQREQAPHADRESPPILDMLDYMVPHSLLDSGGEGSVLMHPSEFLSAADRTRSSFHSSPASQLAEGPFIDEPFISAPPQHFAPLPDSLLPMEFADDNLALSKGVLEADSSTLDPMSFLEEV